MWNAHCKPRKSGTSRSVLRAVCPQVSVLVCRFDRLPPPGRNAARRRVGAGDPDKGANGVDRLAVGPELQAHQVEGLPLGWGHLVVNWGHRLRPVVLAAARAAGAADQVSNGRLPLDGHAYLPPATKHN